MVTGFSPDNFGGLDLEASIEPEVSYSYDDANAVPLHGVLLIVAMAGILMIVSVRRIGAATTARGVL